MRTLVGDRKIYTQEPQSKTLFYGSVGYHNKMEIEVIGVVLSVKVLFVLDKVKSVICCLSLPLALIWLLL